MTEINTRKRDIKSLIAMPHTRITCATSFTAPKSLHAWCARTGLTH